MSCAPAQGPCHQHHWRALLACMFVVVNRLECCSPMRSNIKSRACPLLLPSHQTRAASEGTRQLASDTLDAMQRCGMTMIRTWAFNDGAGWNALQTAPGKSFLLSSKLCR